MRKYLCILAASVASVVSVASLAVPASVTAHARKFPVPSCRWLKTATVGRALGERVKAMRGQWNTAHAPILTCAYQERSPQLQLGNLPFFAIQYSELQFYRVYRGETAIGGIGHCITHIDCPKPGRPAWLVTTTNKGTRARAPYIFTYVDKEELFVQDGANAIAIEVENPNGPLHIKNETATLKRLVRRVMARFYWT